MRKSVIFGLAASGMIIGGVGFAGTFASSVAIDGGNREEGFQLLGPSLAALGVGVGLLAAGYTTKYGAWDNPMDEFHFVYNEELRRDLELPKRPEQAGPCSDSPSSPQ